jgi:acyl-homoserine lactone acylase PvdQ
MKRKTASSSTLLCAVAAVFLFSAATETQAGRLRSQGLPGDGLASRVEVIRTAYGVPHIRAKDLRAALSTSRFFG